LTEKVHEILKSLVASSTVAARIIPRAKVILMAFDKQSNSEIAQKLNLERHCVGRWRRRWQLSFDALLAIEINETNAALRRSVIDVLSDAHRSGRPSTFSNEQLARVISMASQSPRDFDRHVDDWVGRELADEAKKQGIVDSISKSRINELLRSVHLKPQHHKGWCFTTEKDQQAFQEQVELVCETYLQAQLLWHTNGTHTVCVDEMTSLQANERRAGAKLPKPNQIGKIECQYTRHGTLSLTGSWDVVAGQMIQTTIDETRTAEDFADHITKTVAVDQEAEWIFVADNLNTHAGEPIVRAVAEMIGFDPSELGDKEKRRGILGSTKSRREFLSDPNHRIRFVFIPKHSSWLNQIEIIFGVIGKRVMRHGSFTSREDLADKLRMFIEYYNRTYAKPVNWTYDGTGKKSKLVKRPRTWREKTQSRKLEQILALVA
jgi:transposase